MDEAKQKIEAFTAELHTCYEDAVKDFVGSTEYQERLAAQKVEGYFDLIEKVGENYPSVDWTFLDLEGEAEEAEVEQGVGAAALRAEVGTENVEVTAPGTDAALNTDVETSSAAWETSTDSTTNKAEATVGRANPAGESMETTAAD